MPRSWPGGSPSSPRTWTGSPPPASSGGPTRVRGRQPFGGNLVVVTGAGSGIGRSVCLAFAANGAEIVAADLNPDTAERTCELIGARGGVAHPYQVDVTSPADMERFAALGARHATASPMSW